MITINLSAEQEARLAYVYMSNDVPATPEQIAAGILADLQDKIDRVEKSELVANMNAKLAERGARLTRADIDAIEIPALEAAVTVEVKR